MASISILGIILIAKKSIWSFILWIIGDVVGIIYYYNSNQIPLIGMMLGFIIANLYAINKWKKNGKKF